VLDLRLSVRVPAARLDVAQVAPFQRRRRENEKGNRQGTNIEHLDLPKGALDEDESNIDPDVERNIESGKKNAA
jgi:hypothetical protein